MTLLRIVLASLFFSSVFFSPWVITVLFACMLLIVSSGYEIIFGGLMLDLLYGVAVPAYAGVPLLFTVFFCILFVASFYIKKHLMFYHNRV
ncbi:hypothetical protein HYW58_00135 [Candidatus Kaiserbacteria bacterium]|nr:hypothetical protein [Candidatus Kaiserbacteria bacterium]